MLHPDEETLVDLALAFGGAASDEADVVAHVAGCETCSATVSGYRETALLVGSLGRSREVLHAPPSEVWDRIEAEIDAMPEEATGVPDPGLAPVTGIDSRRASRDPDRERRRPGWARVAPWAVGAAAAGIAIGLVAGRAVWQDDGPAPGVTTVASTPLYTLDTAKNKGEATVVKQDGALDLTVDTAALDPGSGYLEVWLINTDGKRMVSVGVLDPAERRATFPISPQLIDQGYLVVDISQEGFDDKPQHSGDSLVRGTLTT